MNKKIIYSLLSGLLLLAYGCESYDDFIPAKFDTILALKETGEKDIRLYSTGEDGEYTFTVLKGGVKDAAAQAEIQVMSEVELSLYSQLVGRTYTLLPESTYEVQNAAISFGNTEGYRVQNIVLKTNAIGELIQNNQEADYVLPVKLVSHTDSVNADNDLVILRPEVVTPVLQYAVSSAVINSTAGSNTYELRLQLPFSSPWDFEAVMSPEAGGVPANYTLVPVSQYTISDAGKVTFKKGSRQSEPITITVNRTSDVLVGNNNVLPLKITDVTIPGFQLPEAPFMLYATEYNRIPLTAAMLSTNAQEYWEGPIANLIDGDPATYFHSSYSAHVADPHYFAITLAEPITRCSFEYQNRNNANGKPQDVVIFGYDGANFKQLARIDQGLPAAAGSVYSSATFVSDTPFTQFYFQVQNTNSPGQGNFFNLAEFKFYGK